jgi:hypothetical protein
VQVVDIDNGARLVGSDPAAPVPGADDQVSGKVLVH